MRLLLVAIAFTIAGCCNCPQPVAEYRAPGEPTEAGSINCTLDARNCERDQRR